MIVEGFQIIKHTYAKVDEGRPPNNHKDRQDSGHPADNILGMCNK